MHTLSTRIIAVSEAALEPVMLLLSQKWLLTRKRSDGLRIQMGVSRLECLEQAMAEQRSKRLCLACVIGRTGLLNATWFWKRADNSAQREIRDRAQAPNSL